LAEAWMHDLMLAKFRTLVLQLSCAGEHFYCGINATTTPVSLAYAIHLTGAMISTHCLLSHAFFEKS